MKSYKMLMCMLVILASSCTQVPREAVELSATVGRDIAEIKKSHLQLLKIHYDGLIKNINDFVDDVYLPYQIQKSLSDDVIKQDMLDSIEAASSESNDGVAQKDAFLKMKYFHLIIHEEVEAYRKLKLSPVKQQYELVLNNLNGSYEQIHYANSIVTGHLASVVKVHDTQNEIIKDTKLNNLRVNVGAELAGVSQGVAELVQQANDKETDLGELIKEFEKLAKKINKE